MLDPKDYHLVSALADAVEDPVGAAASGPDSGEVVAEWLADSVRIVDRASVAQALRLLGGLPARLVAENEVAQAIHQALLAHAATR